MEYIVYISRSKIDMLYSQLDKSILKYKINGKLEFGPLSGEFSNSSNDEINYFKKLNSIIENIEPINTIFEKSPSYISCKMDMSWRTLNYTPEATYWVGESENMNCRSKVMLIGSACNIVGNPTLDSVPHYSPLAYFLAAYRKDLELENQYEKIDRIAKLYNKEAQFVRIIEESLSYAREDNSIFANYKFIAKCLCSEMFTHTYDGKTENYIIATPLFVSIP